MENLIFDRTQLDILNKTYKGEYNISDLNRVEAWCKYLAELLTSYSYPVRIITRLDWKISDFPLDLDIERIRQNIATIKEAYTTMKSTPPLPDTLNPIDIPKANAIEKILYDINLLIDNMEASFLYCGTFNSGESEGLI